MVQHGLPGLAAFRAAHPEGGDAGARRSLTRQHAEEVDLAVVDFIEVGVGAAERGGVGVAGPRP